MIAVQEVTSAADVFRLAQETRRKAREREQAFLARQKAEKARIEREAEQRKLEAIERSMDEAQKIIVIRETGSSEVVPVLEVSRSVSLVEIEARGASLAIARARTHPPLEFIMMLVCREYGISRVDVCSHRRQAPLQDPRRAYCWIARKLTLHSLPSIAAFLGGRDHTTAIHCLKKINAKMAADEKIAARVNALCSLVETSWAAVKRQSEMMEGGGNEPSSVD